MKFYTEFKFRDLLAFPVLILATWIERLAIAIGGTWTAEMILDSYEWHAKKIRSSKGE